MKYICLRAPAFAIFSWEDLTQVVCCRPTADPGATQRVFHGILDGKPLLGERTSCRLEVTNSGVERVVTIIPFGTLRFVNSPIARQLTVSTLIATMKD